MDAGTELTVRNLLSSPQTPAPDPLAVLETLEKAVGLTAKPFREPEPEPIAILEIRPA
jgi:hypothetical protein